MSELESLFSQAPAEPPEPPEQPERRKWRRRLQSASLYSKTVVVLVVLALIGGGGEYYRLHRDRIPALPPVPQGTPNSILPPGDPLHTNFAIIDAAEQSYFKVYAQWTSDKKALDDYGVGTSLQPGTVILVGANPAKDFCFVGSFGDRAPYLLFDSARHGVQAEPALTAIDAASRCSDHTIKNFYPVT